MQAEFTNLSGMQIDSGGYAGLTHGGVPIGSFVIYGNTRHGWQMLSQKAGVASALPGIQSRWLDSSLT